MEPGEAGDVQGRMRNWRRMVTPDWTPLRHRELRLFLLGRFTSFLGSMVTAVAVPFQVYRLTHSPLAVGMLGLVDLVPLLAFVFLGGAIADARDRRLVALVTEALLAVASALLILNALQAKPLLWAVYAISGVQSGLIGLQRPALAALMPRLVAREELTATSALSSGSLSLAMLLGPALGGLLISSIGLSLTYGIDVLTFLASIWLLASMASIEIEGGGERPSLKGVVEGLRHAAGRPELIGTYLVDFVAMLFGMPMALYPPLAAEYGGAGVLGLMYSAPAVGAFLVNATSGWTTQVHRQGSAVILAALAWGLAVVGFGLAHTLWLALCLLALAGAADMVSGVFRNSIWNHTIPDAVRGRLASIEIVSYSSGPLLGNVESGIAARLFNVRTAVVSGGALCVVGVALAAVMLPPFRAYDDRS